MDSSHAILYYIQHLAVLTHRQSDQVLQDQLGIGMSQYRILKVLQTNPSVQQKQIALLLGQTEASISRQVKLMQERSLLSAQVNPANKREHVTMLQPKGQQVLESGAQILSQYHRPSLGVLSPDEQTVLLKMLSKLAAVA